MIHASSERFPPVLPAEAWRSIQSKVKSFDRIPKWIPLPSESIRLTSSDWAILRLVDGRRTIREIVDELKTDIFVAGRVDFSLLTLGVLRPDETPDPHDEALDLVPRRSVTKLAEGPFELTAQEWETLSRVDGSRSLGSLREAVNLPPPALMKVVRGLKDRGFLRLVGRKPERQGGD